jgi:hypothetical protein
MGTTLVNGLEVMVLGKESPNRCLIQTMCTQQFDCYDVIDVDAQLICFVQTTCTQHFAPHVTSSKRKDVDDGDVSYCCCSGGC